MAGPISNPESCCNSSSTKLRAWFRRRSSGAASTSGRQATAALRNVPNARSSAGNVLQNAFPAASTYSSHGYGNQVAVSLPTRWATVVASGYMGADLRFMFGWPALVQLQPGGRADQQSERPLGRWLFHRGVRNQRRRQLRHCTTNGGTRLRRLHPGWLPHLALVQC